jgi:ribosome biogenesis GTPase A
MSIAEHQAVLPASSKFEAIASQIRELCDVIVELDRQSADLGLSADIQAANWHRSLFQHIKPRVEGRPYLLVAVVGGTNTGKSTIFNQLAGASVSRVCDTACGTKQPVCIVPRDFFKNNQNNQPQQVFPGFKTRQWESNDDALAESSENLLFLREDDVGRQPPNLLLLDTPDIDGWLEEH